VSAPDGLRRVHDFGPVLVKGSPEGEFVDGASKPFDGDCDGLAWDGTHLWILDSANRQICMIERVGGL
jgi:hypothetical protein